MSSSTTQSRASLPHVPALDGLRGLAVLAVVLFHFAPDLAPGGFLGVDLFFVLSGYLITSLLVRELQSTDTISLLSFWARRARRLLPALFLLLLGVGVYVLVLSDPVEARRFANDGLGAFGYVANWHFIAQNESYIQRFLAEQGGPSPFRHMWSLAIEEQFYLLWPLIVLGASRLMRARQGNGGASPQWFTRRAIAIACVIVGLASIAWMRELYRPGDDPSRVYFGTDTHASLLLVGSALGALAAGALALRNRVQQRLLVAAGCGAALGLVALVATIDTNSTWLYEGGYLGIGLLLVVLLAAAGQPGVNPLRSVFELKPMVGLGLISYGVYLWHWPASVWITESGTGLDGIALFALRSVATLTAAIASFFLVEQPIRRGWLSRQKNRIRFAAPAAAAIVIAVVLLVPALTVPSVETFADASSTTPKGNVSWVEARVSASESATKTEAITAFYSQAPRCDDSSLTEGESTLLGGQRVLLIGNSVAVELRSCLQALLASRGAFLTSVTENASYLCQQSTDVKRALNTSKHPTIAIVFWVPGPTPGCGSAIDQVRSMVSTLVEANTHVVIAPMPPRAGESHAPTEQGDYEQLVARYPDQVTLADAGIFLRDVRGNYQWRMPCLDGEPGCALDGTVPVRTPFDGGAHFCSDPNFRGASCTGTFAAGQRRASSAIAQGVFAASEALADVGGYSSAPRCDTSAFGNPSAVLTGQSVLLFGNSFAREVDDCLGAIVRSRGGKFSSVTYDAAVLCQLRKDLRKALRDPSTRPTVGIVFWAPIARPSACPESAIEMVEEAVSDFEQVGARVILVPMVPKAGTNELPIFLRAYQDVAATDPDRVSVVDAGEFLRDAKGVYQWRMPCIGKEPGCDSDGTVTVRNADDEGSHFCAETERFFSGHPCPETFAAGERRASAAIAKGLFAVFKPPG